MKRILTVKIKDVGIMSLILRNLLADIFRKHSLKVLSTFSEFDIETKTSCHFIKVELDTKENFDFIDLEIKESD